ncbi:DUF6264 family protein [Leifsonia shinshuensis]|uniref:DUF6264 family protein n=1 Tax=Leifsonia shinshuensis TaxID=150026 RepID=UPI001623AF00|nr:DUF6264 family protein [Leifsonia shinshuensis]
MSEHDPEKAPDERPRPKYGELAPPGWVWKPPQDADRLDTTHHSPAASEVEQPPAPPQQPGLWGGQHGGGQQGGGQQGGGPHNGDQHGFGRPGGPQGHDAYGRPYSQSPQLRADAPRWNITTTIVLLVVGFFGMSYTIGTLQSLPSVMQLMHTSLNLGKYVQDPSVAPLITVGTIAMAGIWAVSLGLSIWLLVQKRLAFYVPLVAGIVAFVTLFVILGLIFSTDPVLLDYYNGIAPATPGPTTPAPSSPPPTSPAPTPGTSA